MKQCLFTTLALASLAATEYVWPSKYDEIEDFLSLQSGVLHRGFIDGVITCGFGTNVQGRQNSAEWIRTAFHDMATHDATAGTGGLDASIFMELDRAENTGAAFNQTFGFFSSFYSSRASASDLLAMSVVVASFSCGGTKIPFRAGRIDAQEPGPAGVPEPQTDLETTRNTFAKAGFSTEDMIAMVACGHTLGGVHSVDFPEIVGVPADPKNDTVTHFDTTTDKFDNLVVSEYLDGTTKNPLVSGANDTLNSDKRIFGADGNKTMQALADSDTFQARCADIFSRMIDTVPASVQLTDPLEATDVKPYITSLTLGQNGSLALAGRIRVRTTSGTGRDPSGRDLNVQLIYAGRDGSGATAIPTRLTTFQGGSSTGLYGENFKWFEFSTSDIPADAGIGSFRIQMTTLSTNETTTLDNGGTGSYPMDDGLLYHEAESCIGPIVDGQAPLHIVALVRKDRAAAGATLTMDLVRKVARQGVIVPKLDLETIPFQPTGQERGEWAVYSANTTVTSNSFSSTFDIKLAGEKPLAVEFQKTNRLSSNNCT